MIDTLKRTVTIGGLAVPLPWVLTAVLAVITIVGITVVDPVGILPSRRSTAETALDAWAQATMQRDYVTAQQYSSDPAFVFGAWRNDTENAQRIAPFTGYEIVRIEQRGQTIEADVRFLGPQPRCTVILQDVTTGHISATKPYRPC